MIKITNISLFTIQEECKKHDDCNHCKVHFICMRVKSLVPSNWNIQEKEEDEREKKDN